jgi:phosphoenolpyruvate carboxylase
MLLSNMDMVLAKSDVAIASRYAELVSDIGLREQVFSRLRAEWQSTVEALLTIMGQESLLESNPLLARSIRHRFPSRSTTCRSSCYGGIARVTRVTKS